MKFTPRETDPASWMAAMRSSLTFADGPAHINTNQKGEQ
jgi:hypothetical protein